jgi:hypothetical protein
MAVKIINTGHYLQFPLKTKNNLLVIFYLGFIHNFNLLGKQFTYRKYIFLVSILNYQMQSVNYNNLPTDTINLDFLPDTKNNNIIKLASMFC